MARERTQGTTQQSTQSNDRARTKRESASASASGAVENRTQGPSADRERTITTNRERGRTTQDATSVSRHGGQSLARSGGSAVSDSPFSLMQRMAEDMDRLMGQFGFGRNTFGLSPLLGSSLDEDGWGLGTLPDSARQSLWSPQIEVLRRGDDLVVRADLPGIDKDDLHVDVEDDMLTIRGERRAEHESRDGGVFRSERSYGQFYRAIPLPEGVDAEQCDATFQNGVLEITMKAPEQKQPNGRRIPIR